jgi:hypothetical protein
MSDRVVTVSPSYREEICTPMGGWGLVASPRCQPPPPQYAYARPPSAGVGRLLRTVGNRSAGSPGAGNRADFRACMKGCAYRVHAATETTRGVMNVAIHECGSRPWLVDVGAWGEGEREPSARMLAVCQCVCVGRSCVWLRLSTHIKGSHTHMKAFHVCVHTLNCVCAFTPCMCVFTPLMCLFTPLMCACKAFMYIHTYRHTDIQTYRHRYIYTHVHTYIRVCV